LGGGNFDFVDILAYMTEILW